METNDRLLRAVQLSARKLVSTGDFDQLLREVLILCIEAVGAFGGTIYLHDPAKRRLRFHHVLPESVAERLPFTDIPDDAGVAGQVFRTRQTVVSQFRDEQDPVRRSVEEATGVVVHTMITVPLMMEDEEPIGVVQLINKLGGYFSDADAMVLDTVASISTMASLNSRLLEESTRASSLLGMGKVSHDIGNFAASLEASFVFAESALDGMKEEFKGNEVALGYAESLEAMLEEANSGINRIVRYSRLISDLSAGKELRPEMKLGTMGETIQRAAAYLESDGRRNCVALRYDIQTDAPATLHDDLFVFRIVQNLAGNAIKAVKETIPDDWHAQFSEDDDAIFGEVLVRYAFEEGKHVISVRDSGPGMPPEVVERLLAGTARSRWDKGSGSGWGMKIVLELASTHQGIVTIDSAPGAGSTFHVTFPHRDTA